MKEAWASKWNFLFLCFAFTTLPLCWYPPFYAKSKSKFSHLACSDKKVKTDRLFWAKFAWNLKIRTVPLDHAPVSCGRGYLAFSDSNTSCQMTQAGLVWPSDCWIWRLPNVRSDSTGGSILGLNLQFKESVTVRCGLKYNIDTRLRKIMYSWTAISIDVYTNLKQILWFGLRRLRWGSYCDW